MRSPIRDKIPFYDCSVQQLVSSTSAKLHPGPNFGGQNRIRPAENGRKGRSEF